MKLAAHIAVRETKSQQNKNLIKKKRERQEKVGEMWHRERIKITIT